MALNIKDPETEELARQLAREMGTSITAAVRMALLVELEATRRKRSPDELFRELMEITERSADRPVLDSRPIEELIPYDENGLPI